MYFTPQGFSCLKGFVMTQQDTWLDAHVPQNIAHGTKVGYDDTKM
jgi:hypothetical protein